MRELAAATVAQEAALSYLYQAAGIGPPSRSARLATTTFASEGIADPAGAADLEVRLLGPLLVSYRGQELAPWPSQRAASLLKFLLLNHGQPVRREVLMETFWPGFSPKSARNNLNVTVYQLRGQFRSHDPSRTQIVYHGGSYRLDPSLSYRVDVDDFTRAAAQGHRAADATDLDSAVTWYQRARALYCGPLLEDEPSGDWFSEAQRRLHLDHCAVLERLCAALLDLDEPSEALAVASQLLEADPCRESAHQLLMRAYAVLRQPHLIVQQFQRCQATMRQELAVEPSPATLDLYMSLLRGT